MVDHPLVQAVVSNNIASVVSCFENGEHIDLFTKHLAMGFCITGNNLKILKVLLDKGVFPSQLRTAVLDRRIDVVKILIEHGANIHEYDQSERQPIHLATCVGSIYMIEHFLSLGVDIDVQTNPKGLPKHGAKTTCLDFALKKDPESKMVEFLLKKGAKKYTMWIPWVKQAFRTFTLMTALLIPRIGFKSPLRRLSTSLIRALHNWQNGNGNGTRLDEVA
jgi:ankyrin repeat protein